jgi:hypothetical protein
MAFGVILIAAGVYLHARVPVHSDGKAFGIKIDKPREKETVGITDVTGTINRRPPESYKLMVFRIYPKDGNAIYPLKPEVRISSPVWQLPSRRGPAATLGRATPIGAGRRHKAGGAERVAAARRSADVAGRQARVPATLGCETGTRARKRERIEW